MHDEPMNLGEREMTREEVRDQLLETKMRESGLAKLAAEERERRGAVERQLALAKRQLRECRRVADGSKLNVAYYCDATRRVEDLRAEANAERTLRIEAQKEVEKLKATALTTAQELKVADAMLAKLERKTRRKGKK